MRRNDYLFLGKRALSKIERRIRREIDAIGAQEVLIESSPRAIAEELRSYRQLPQIWYQFSGLSMQSFSFDLDGSAFDAMAKEVGQICGDEPRESFEDAPGDLSPEEFHTPGRRSIADVSQFTGLPPTMQMKSLVVVADGEVVLALVRGDQQLDREKLKWFLDAGEVRPASGDEIRNTFGADAGSLGPMGAKVRIVCDESLHGRRNLICGANRNDYHLRNVTPGKDFDAEFHDIRDDSAPIKRMRSAKSTLQVTGEKGESIQLAEGACEIFLDRLLDRAAELHCDADGLAWPDWIAPFAAIISPVNFADEMQRRVALDLHDSAPADLLLDDRDERPGVKFKDADLIGIPYRITLGKKLADGVVDLRDRRARISQDVRVEDALRLVMGKQS